MYIGKYGKLFKNSWINHRNLKKFLNFTDCMWLMWKMTIFNLKMKSIQSICCNKGLICRKHPDEKSFIAVGFHSISFHMKGTKKW